MILITERDNHEIYKEMIRKLNISRRNPRPRESLAVVAVIAKRVVLLEIVVAKPLREIEKDRRAVIGEGLKFIIEKGVKKIRGREEVEVEIEVTMTEHKGETTGVNKNIMIEEEDFLLIESLIEEMIDQD